MTSWLAMAKIIVCGFILFFSPFGSATYCTNNNDCDTWLGESCCSDSVCRGNCYYCSYNSECGTGEQCCDGGDCLWSCPTTSPWTLPTLATIAPFSPWTFPTIAPLTYATVAPSSYCTYDYDCESDDVCCDGECLAVCSSTWTGGSIAGAVFGTIVFFSIIFSFVSCYFCAWCPYYRYRPPATVIVSRQVPYQPFVTSTHTTMTQNMPPPPSYNQAAPPGATPPGCQPPPPYSGYPQQPAQCPPPASGQPSVAPKATA